MEVLHRSSWIISSILHILLLAGIGAIFNLKPVEQVEKLRIILSPPPEIPQTIPEVELPPPPPVAETPQETAQTMPGAAAPKATLEQVKKTITEKLKKSKPKWIPLTLPSRTENSIPIPQYTFEDVAIDSESSTSSSTNIAQETKWASTGDRTYLPPSPPLPPKTLVPLEGSHWNILFVIPSIGGLPLQIEGLDTGHPHLDAWLLNYIKDLTFPPSPTGENYRVKWILDLQVRRPE